MGVLLKLLSVEGFFWSFVSFLKDLKEIKPRDFL